MAVLRLEGVVKTYGTTTALDGIDLDLAAGQILGLVGNNGAGKTTTLKLVSGILNPTKGTVRLDGQDPSRPEARHAIGFLPEDSPLYDDQSPLEYLHFFARLYKIPRRDARLRITALLEAIRLDRPFWKRPIGQLSKGSARKVAIARALLHRPRLVIMDEPASGLDPATRRELEDVIIGLRTQGNAVILSAHNLAQVERLCDRIVLLHEGRIIAAGSLDELRHRFGGWSYTVRATTPFGGSRPDGPVHAADFGTISAAQAAMDQVARGDGMVVQMESIAPSLDEILRRAAGA